MTKLVLTQGLIVGVCAASLSAATASSDPGVPFHDVLIGISSAPGATVTERVTPTGAPVTQYDWADTNDTGIQASITSLNGTGYRWGGIVWGAELVAGFYDITPGAFNVAGSTYKNSSGESLRYQTIGGNLILGYEYGISLQDGLQAFVTVLPYAGGGIGFADSELLNFANVMDRQRGSGKYGDYGIKFGGYLTERRWIYGLLVGFERSSSKVTIDFSNASSEMTLKRSGATFGFQAGYRF
jgi:hypothetical protein